METESFKQYLQAELLRRCRANPRYSLRAFSKSLSIEPSFLSKLLNGKRAITSKSMERLGQRLGLTSEQIGKFRIQSDGNPSRPKRETKNSFVRLDPDRFKIISEWHHYAILELLRIPKFDLNPRSVARALGIRVVEAKDAISRLERLGMLPDQGVGSRAVPANHTTVGAADTTAAFRQLQKQILEMALKALSEIPVEQRDQSSMTMAIDRKLLPEARRRIREFRRSLDRFLQSSGTPDSVYHLSISLYPVTQSKLKKGKIQ